MRPALLSLVIASLCGPAFGSRSDLVELHIAVGLLRSQAAELVLLRDQAADGHLPKQTLHAHTKTLGDEIHRAAQQLSKVPPPPGLQDLHAAVQALGRQMASIADAMDLGRLPDDGAAQSLLQRLLPAEQQLEQALAR